MDPILFVTLAANLPNKPFLLFYSISRMQTELAVERVSLVRNLTFSKLNEFATYIT